MDNITYFFLKTTSSESPLEVLHQKYNDFICSGISSKHQMRRDWNRERMLLFLILFCACHHAAIADIEITQPWHEQNLSLRTRWQVQEQLLDWSLLKTHHCRQLWKFIICLPQLKHFPSYLYHVSIHFSTLEMRKKTKFCSFFENIWMIQPSQ